MRELNLLVLDGTVPMWYQGTKYNVPVQIYLPEHFPRKAPMMYVRPVQGMFIKPNHPTVNADGFVNSLYLRDWQAPPNVLADAVEDASILFSSESPVFSKPRAAAGQQPPPPTARPSNAGVQHHTNPLQQNSQLPPTQAAGYPPPGAGSYQAASRPNPPLSAGGGYPQTEVATGAADG